MKLLRCFIANYGCLHHFTCDFTSPIHIICKPNGWGKSTLISFLCSMLYGLESSSRRSIADNERKHYTPWQGGTFGGSIEFEANGSFYRAERTFGSREKEDTFCLYNLQTMQPSQDFSGNLGQELFGIDRSGFLHTICIPQGSLSAESNDSITARLCGIMESQDDILQYEKAISSIDSVLRTYVKTGKRGRIDTLLQEEDQVAQQLLRTAEASHQAAAVMDQIAALEEQKNSCTLELEHLRKKMHHKAQQSLYAHYRTLQSHLQDAEAALEQDESFFHDQFPDPADITLYLEQCTELSELEKQYRETCLSETQNQEYHLLQTVFAADRESCDTNSADTVFPDMIISDMGFSDTDFSYTGFSDNLSDNFSERQKKLLLNSSLYQMEAGILFSTDIEYSAESAASSPIREEHGEQLSVINDARNQFFRFQSLQSDFSKANAECEELHQKLSEIHDLLADSGKQDAGAGGSLTALFFLPILLCILIFAVLCFAFSLPAAGIIFSLMELAWILYGFCLYMKHRKETSVYEQQKNQLSVLLHEKQKQCSSFSDSMQTCITHISTCFRQLDLPDPGNTLTEENCLLLLNQYYEQLINQRQLRVHREKQIARQKEFYARLKKKYLDYNRLVLSQQRNRQNFYDIMQNISGFLSPYYTLPEEISSSFLENRLFDLQTRLSRYLTAMNHMKTASEEIHRFLYEHPDFDRSGQELSESDCNLSADGQELFTDEQKLSEKDRETAGDMESLPQLQQQEYRIQEHLDFCTAEIVKLQSELLPLQSLADTRSGLEDRKAHLTKQIENCRTHYHTLSLTSQYLKQAREQFTGHYLKSIENHFQNYISLFGREVLSDITLDSAFHALIPDHGILYHTDWFSKGTQDLIHFCIRLSIITDLYPDEAPFLILDDPFVNLDDSARRQASEILNRLSDKWQIIYLTCHEDFLQLAAVSAGTADDKSPQDSI
ncbi:MAG: AAA family ATPase [Lachnospiraceae bacterium]